MTLLLSMGIDMVPKNRVVASALVVKQELWAENYTENESTRLQVKFNINNILYT